MDELTLASLYLLYQDGCMDTKN